MVEDHKAGAAPDVLVAENRTLRARIRALEAERDALSLELAALKHSLHALNGDPVPAGSIPSLGALRHLVLAAEHKDHDTGAHLVRIGYFCGLLAPHCGCDTDFVRRLLMASPMHDIGKIGIPDQILKKIGVLSVDERHVMSHHAEYGARILSGSDDPVLHLAAEIALTHHEHFDGQGYPYGLKGDEIPLSGRIVAVTDVFDALAMHRTYRTALPVERAFDVLRSGRGRHFDPDVVDAFIGMGDDVLALRELINRGELPALPPELFPHTGDPFAFYTEPLHSTPLPHASDAVYYEYR